MKRSACVAVLALLGAWGCSGEEPPERRGESDALSALARCLTERGAVYYGAAGCSSCRAQKRAFGAAFAAVTEVECHPHVAGSQAERCVDRSIRVTPTWLIERDGRELQRLEGAQRPADLAAFSGCPYTISARRESDTDLRVPL